MADEIVENMAISYTTGIEVILKYNIDAPTVCRVYRNGILIFVGEDDMGKMKV